ncbi:hypothetical protein Q1695_006032 [Nippostrongylus brasiliensis]|nr:hypothetical protein Q1695_006032 [Nippostrongylus brasiliensis]
MSPEEFLKADVEIVDSCLAYPFSTVVRCRNTKKIVGVLLITVFSRTDGYSEIGFTSSKNPRVRAVANILNELHNSFFDLVPSHVNRVLHREISNVAKAYQRRGIASKMMNFGLSKEKLMEHQINGIMSETSSIANQKLLAKNGFRPLKTILLRDVKGEDGQALLQTDDGTEKAVLNWKPIEEWDFRMFWN